MNGYVASGRIARGTARVGHPRSETRAALGDDPPIGAAVAWIEAPADDPRPGALRERWSAARERWSQLTFYLFDPNSWR